MGRSRVHLDADYTEADEDVIRFCAAATRLGMKRGALLKELVRRFVRSCEEEITQEREATEAQRRTFRREQP